MDEVLVYDTEDLVHDVEVLDLEVLDEVLDVEDEGEVDISFEVLIVKVYVAFFVLAIKYL